MNKECILETSGRGIKSWNPSQKCIPRDTLILRGTCAGHVKHIIHCSMHTAQSWTFRSVCRESWETRMQINTKQTICAWMNTMHLSRVRNMQVFFLTTRVRVSWEITRSQLNDRNRFPMVTWTLGYDVNRGTRVIYRHTIRVAVLEWNKATQASFFIRSVTPWVTKKWNGGYRLVTIMYLCWREILLISFLSTITNFTTLRSRYNIGNYLYLFE